MTGPLQPPPQTHATPPPPALAWRGLWAIFTATFFELVGYFMLAPWLLLRLGLRAGTACSSGWISSSSTWRCRA